MSIPPSSPSVRPSALPGRGRRTRSRLSKRQPPYARRKPSEFASIENWYHAKTSSLNRDVSPSAAH